MHSRCTGTLLMGTVVISVALATMKPDNVKKPYGPKMCERLCNQIAGCSSYIYRISDLLCQLTPTTLQNQEKGIYLIKVTKDKERIHADNALNCNEGEQFFRSRRHDIKCRSILSSLPTLTNKEDVADGRMTRLLMMPRVSAQPGRQLYLANNSIVTYPFLDSNEVGAIAYIPSQRKLVMSTIIPDHIVFVPVDVTKKTVVKTENRIASIAIDDEKQLMFLKSVHPKTCVCLMRLKDNTQTLLFELSYKCSIFPTLGELVLDQKRSLIYVLCTYSKILNYTYQGVSKGHMHANVAHGGLYMIGYSLYYQKETNVLVQMFLSDFSVTTLETLMLPPIQMLLKFGDSLYMVPFTNGEHILVANRSGMGNIRKLNTGFGKDMKKILMCFIP